MYLPRLCGLVFLKSRNLSFEFCLFQRYDNTNSHLVMKFLKLVVSILLKPMLRRSEQVRCSLYRRRKFPFRKQAMPFSRHLENFLTINKFFSAKLEKKGNYLYNHPASNPERLLPNIPFIPLRYQVNPSIF